MIVVSQLLSRIGSLLKVGTPESSDTIIRIPNTVLEPIPFPTVLPIQLTGQKDDSFVAVMSSVITNSAATTTPFNTLAPGIWRLTWYIDSEFNWLDANPVNADNQIRLFTRCGRKNFFTRDACRYLCLS